MAIGESDNKLKIVVEVDSATGEARIEGLSDKLKETKRETESAGGGFANFGVNVASGLYIAEQAFEALGVAASFIPELAERGEGVQDLADSFASLGGQETTITKASNALQGLVSNSDLLKSANQALIAGVPDVNNNFELLASTAQKLSNTLGIDTVSALDQLVSGLGKAQDKQLQMLGINVDSEAVNKRYADSIGKTVEQLTELEKKQAFQVEALKQISEVNQRLPGEGESVANSFDRIGIAVDNALDKIAIGVNSSEDLARVIDDLSAKFNQIDWERIANGLAVFINETVRLTETLVDLVGWLKELYDLSKDPFFSKQAIQNLVEVEKLTAQIPEQLNKLNQEITNIKTNADLSKAKKSFEDLTKAVYSTDQTTREYQEIITSLSKKLSEVEISEKKVTEATGEHGKALDKSGKETKETKKELDLYDKEIKELIKDYKAGEVSQEIFLKTLKEIEKTSKNAGKAVEDYGDSIESALRDQSKKVEQAQNELLNNAVGQGVSDFQSALEQHGGEYGKAFSDFLNVEFVNAEGEIENIGASIAKSLTNGIQEAFGTSGGASGALGGALTGLTMSLGNIVTAITEDDEKKRNKAIGAAVGAVIGGAIAAAFTLGIGTSAGAAIGSIIGEIIGGLFKHDDHDVKEFRQGLFKLINDTIKDMRFDSDLLFEEIFRIPTANDTPFDYVDYFTAITQGLSDKMAEALPESSIENFWMNFAEQIGSKADDILGQEGASQGAVKAIKNYFQDALAKGMSPIEILNGLKELGLGEAINQAIDEVLAQTTDSSGAPITVTDFLYDMLDISEELQESFTGLGIAFGVTFAGQHDLIQNVIHQYEAMLALNFQNAEGLNELQMVIQGTGISLKDMESALEKAFLSGQISFDEYIKGLQAARDLHTQGIPGAIGATNIAMNNLVEDGFHSGLAAMDALGDMAAEAMEKGITSVAGLRDELIAQGFDIKQVDILMQALAQNGITDLTQLKDVTAEQTATILHWLNNLGFQFDETNTQIDGSNQRIQQSQQETQQRNDETTRNYEQNNQKRVESHEEANTEIEQSNDILYTKMAESLDLTTLSSEQLTQVFEAFGDTNSQVFKDWQASQGEMSGDVKEFAKTWLGVDDKILESKMGLNEELSESNKQLMGALISDLGLSEEQTLELNSAFGELGFAVNDGLINWQAQQDGVILRMAETQEKIAQSREESEDLNSSLNNMPERKPINLVLNTEDGDLSPGMQALASFFSNGGLNIWDQMGVNNNTSGKPSGNSVGGAN